jgi:hypothetical protein
VSGVALVPLTDKELNLLIVWYYGQVVSSTNGLEDDELYEKLEAHRAEVACVA